MRMKTPLTDPLVPARQVLGGVQQIGDPVDPLALDDRQLGATGRLLAGAEEHGLGRGGRGVDLVAAATAETVVSGDFGTAVRTELAGHVRLDLRTAFSAVPEHCRPCGEQVKRAGRNRANFSIGFPAVFPRSPGNF